MSSELGAAIRASTPSGNGRDSPILRVSRQLHEDGINPKDKSYRRYAHGVERALASFESPQQEWADYISFLGRLTKALQAHPADLHVIHDSRLIATRLAQCLTPALPPGVHRKAIELYSHIFDIVGRDRLKTQLHLWLPGLVPVLTFASLAIRPELLALLDRYILSLDTTYLHAPLKAIILCILPGLEDESSEDHESWLALLTRARPASASALSQTASFTSELSYFWQTFFLAVITNPSRRLGALSYLSRELPTFATGAKDNSIPSESSRLSPAAAAVVSPEPGLLIRCMSAGLTDKQILVQRGFLDILVTRLPLNSDAIQMLVSPVDVDQLVLAAVSVVGRKDMSLNRRLWNWFLGPDAKDDAENVSVRDPQSPVLQDTHQVAYFARYGLPALSRSIIGQFTAKSLNAASTARPFRLCLALMDRWEVGGLLIPDVLIPAMRSALQFHARVPQDIFNEVSKSASNFFDGVESSLIWGTINMLVAQAFDVEQIPQDKRSESMALCSFIIMTFNIREEEMIMVHIPQTTCYLLAHLRRFYTSDQANSAPSELLTEASVVLERLQSLIPPRAFSGPQKASDLAKRRAQNISLEPQDIIERVDACYTHNRDSNTRTNMASLSLLELGSSLICQAAWLLFHFFTATPESLSIDICTKVLCGILSIVPQATIHLVHIDITRSLHVTLTKHRSDKAARMPFRILLSLSAVLYTTQTSTSPIPDAVGHIEDIRRIVLQELWNFLDAETSKHHVEAVRCLWQLDNIDPARRLLEAVIATSLSRGISTDVQRTNNSRLTACLRFTIFWTHSAQDRSTLDKSAKVAVRKASSTFTAPSSSSIPNDPSGVLTRPLIVILGYLINDGDAASSFIRSWLHDLPQASSVLLILIEQLLALDCITDSDADDSTSVNTLSDHQECLYYLRLVLAVIQINSEQIWVSLADTIAQDSGNSNKTGPTITCQALLVQLALRALNVSSSTAEDDDELERNVHLCALDIITELVNGRYPRSLIDIAAQEPLIARLQAGLPAMHPLVQAATLRALLSALRLLSSSEHNEPSPSPNPLRNGSKDELLDPVNLPTDTRATGRAGMVSSLESQRLIDCLKLGLESPSALLALDSWVEFLIDVVPLFSDVIFQNLLPLVDCLCKQINLSFRGITQVYSGASPATSGFSDSALVALLNALEHLIANAHHRTTQARIDHQTTKLVEQPQGFFGNMVQGVFTTEHGRATQSSAANSRLTVLLCFQDAIRACFAIWSWGSNIQEKSDVATHASHSYTAIKLRNRARRLLEHLFAAEALESMETLARIWDMSSSTNTENVTSVFGLLNVLSGAKPKHIIPAIFNAIYSRTNPASLEPSKMSSLTSELNDIDLVAFLIEYTKTLDDDAMDEIWIDCMTFLRDVLANPLPHSQILASLLLFVTLLAQKVENTNFGEQRKMRRELGDIFLRILMATFTTRPMGFLQDAVDSTGDDRAHNAKTHRRPDVLSALSIVIPQLSVILGDSDKVQSAVQSIGISVIGPTLKAKAFPSNVQPRFLSVLYELTKIVQGAKLWKKDVADAFNDPKFFGTSSDLLRAQWLLILAQFVHNDKERMPEIISRLAAPSTAGIVFGVGATSARLEADKRTQANLRRIALLVLAAPNDTFSKNVGSIAEKISELSVATNTSSPSCSILGDVYMLLRALLLRLSSANFAPIWPLANMQLQAALSSILHQPSEASDRFSNTAVLQAAKLLDLLVTLNQDDLQMHSWLFVSDSIDVMHYRPDKSATFVALADAITDELSQESTSNASVDINETPRSVFTGLDGRSVRRPVLPEMLRSIPVDVADVRAMAKEDLIARVLRPFFGQLSLLCYEATYDMVEVDSQYCLQVLLEDLFEDIIT